MIKISGATHSGRVRDHNEDAIFSDAASGLAVVADGMGGHASGEVASQITIETFAQGVNADLAATLLRAHAAIVARAVEQPESKGMGATVVAVQADEKLYRVAWVGDSRVYYWQRGSGLRQVSRDHSYLEWMLRTGEITEAEARVHPQRNVVTQALGLNSPQPDSVIEAWRGGDRLLLCSDGLTDELEDAQIEALLGANAELESAASALIEAALRNGGRDNVSVVLLENATAAAAPTRGRWSTLWPVFAGIAAALLGAIVFLVLQR